MKEKRIFAMFITSAVTLVASLVVTFGVLMTLADPVVATGITRYEFNYGVRNEDNIAYGEDSTLMLKEDVIFQPSSALAWDMEPEDVDSPKGKITVDHPVWFSETMAGDITYIDESIASRVKVIPFKINNATNGNMQVNINVTYDKTTMLGKYTFVKIYNFSTGTFEDASYRTVSIQANTAMEFAVVVLADDSANTSRNTVNWGKDYSNINVVVTKIG